jgi:hypothetical protein
MLPLFVHHELNEKPQTGEAPNSANYQNDSQQ